MGVATKGGCGQTYVVVFLNIEHLVPQNPLSGYFVVLWNNCANFFKQ